MLKEVGNFILGSVITEVFDQIYNDSKINYNTTEFIEDNGVNIGFGGFY